MKSNRRELKAEATCIRTLDHLIQINSAHRPCRVVSFDQIDAEVRNALKYIRAGTYALRPPRLKEEVGVYASDGLVPDLLHREVRIHLVLMAWRLHPISAQLVTELDSLAEIEPKDFHPGTRGKVCIPVTIQSESPCRF